MAASSILESLLNFVRRVVFAAWLVGLLAELVPTAAVAAEVTIVWPLGVSAYPAIQSGDEALGGIWLSFPVTQGEAARVRVRSTDLGTAVPGEDFVPIDGVYSVHRLDSGSGEKIPIQLIPDSIPEGQQTIVFEVSAVSPDTLIRNNDGLMKTSLLVTVHFLDDDTPNGRAIFPPQPSHTETAGTRPGAPIIADLNRDGRADVVVALEADHAVAVLLGRTNGWFSPAPGSPFPAGKLPVAPAVADLDGDDLPDVLAINRMDNSITFLKGDGQGGLAAPGTAIPTGVEPRAVRVADFNGDTRPDLLVSNYGDGTLSLLLGDGRGGFREGPGSPIIAGNNPWGLAVGDFDQNGTVDFAVALRSDDALRVFLNQKDGSIQSSLLPVGSQPFDVAVADLDRDGKLDLISADTWSHSVTAFRGKGDGTFEKVGTYGAGGSFPRMVVPVDLNRDGYPELAVLNEHSSVGLLTGVGQTSAGQAGTLPGSPLSPPGILSTLAAGDLNGDGSPDLVVCGPDSGLSFWLNRIRGNFVEVEVPPVRESNRIARINIRRTQRIEEPLRLLVSTRDGTAVAGRDYQGVSGELLFLAGETNKVVEVPILDDDLWSGSRAFALDLLAPDSPVIVPERTEVTILDDEPEVRVVVRTDPDLGTVSERSERIRFLVNRTAPNTRVAPFEVQYRVEAALGSPSHPAVPGVDFEAVNGTLRFEEGVTEQSFEIRLHDNFEVDGSRAFRVVLTGRPGSPTEVVWDGDIEIRDDELAYFGQEMVVAPFLHGWAEDDRRQAIPLSDGRTLVWSGNWLLFLSPEGIPDPAIVQGTGLTRVPFTVADFSDLRVLTLSDGSLYLVGRRGDSNNTLTVVRIKSDGRLNEAYGDGKGTLSIPDIEVGDLRSAVFVGPDDGLVLCFSQGGTFRVRRLTVAGRWDAQFQEWTHAGAGASGTEVVVSPRGTILARVATGELVRLQSDGRLDPNFKSPAGLTLPFYFGSGFWFGEPAAAFDAQDRLYVGMGGSEATLVRILGDGSVDRAYQPQLGAIPEGWGVSWKVLPTGEVIAVLPPQAVVRIAADGTVRQRHDFEFGHGWVGGVLPQRNGDTLVQVWRRGLPGWWGGGRDYHAYDVILYADGTMATFPPIPISANVWTDGHGHVGLSSHFNSFMSAGNPFRWQIPRQVAEAGLLQTGVFCWSDSVRLTIQRSGSTAVAAAVRGRLGKLEGGRWNEATVRTWGAQFPTGVSETSVDLSALVAGVSGTYLVRLEEAVGVQLGAFTACQLWVLPGTGTSTNPLVAVQVPDTSFGSELLLLQPDDAPWLLQESSSPNGPWNWAAISAVGSIGSSWVRKPQPSPAGARFFRHFRP